jgi:RNA polymerase sigma factor (sigma-70 family)
VTDLSGPSAGEVSSFLSKVARNELLDMLKRESRRVEPTDTDGPEWYPGSEKSEGVTMSATDSPDALVERREFAEALRRCAEGLDSRSRLIWFFRVFYSMATKDIAVHPRINIKTGHVDVILQRARKAIRECMNLKGFDPTEIPQGTFTELWSAFRPERAAIEGY